jgi:hypothetical protein
MNVTCKETDLIEKNLCLPKNTVNKVLRSCKTIGDVAAIDLGLTDKNLEQRIKNSMISLLFKLNSRKKGY